MLCNLLDYVIDDIPAIVGNKLIRVESQGEGCRYRFGRRPILQQFNGLKSIK